MKSATKTFIMIALQAMLNQVHAQTAPADCVTYWNIFKTLHGWDFYDKGNCCIKAADGEVVTCVNGRIRNLKLASFSGYVSDEIGKLTELQTLEIADGTLTKGLPPGFGNLKKLVSL